MASYEELYNIIVEESIKGEIGRVGLKLHEKHKENKKINQDIEDFNKIEGISSTRHNISKLPGAKHINNAIDSKAGEIAGKVAKKTASVATYPISASAEALAKFVTKFKEKQIKNKYSNDPKTLEKELRKNLQKLDELTSDIMAVEVWALAWPVAVNTAFQLDGAFKALIAAGGIARGDMNLAKGAAKAMAWVPAAVAMLGKCCNSELDIEEVGKYLEKTTKRLLDTLDEWAKSDEPLLEPVNKENSRSISPKMVTESTNDNFVFMVCESFANNKISFDEVMYLFESMLL